MFVVHNSAILPRHELIKNNSLSMSSEYYIARALLESGWAEDLLIKVSDEGTIESIISHCKSNNVDTKRAEIIKGTVIPGMANLHSHAFQRAFAGLTEFKSLSSMQQPDSFWSWRKIMYEFVQRLTPERLNIIAKQLYIEMLKSGYTTVGEFHYLHHNANGELYDDPGEMSHQVINAALESGIGITHLPVYYRYSGFTEQLTGKTIAAGQQRFIHQSNDYFRLLETLNTHYRSESLFKLGIAPHSLRAVSTDDINKAIGQLNNIDPKAPIHIHIAEQQAEVEDCQVALGKRPIEHLMNTCDVNERWCLVHATHMDDTEVADVAQSKAVAGLCLTTEANLGDGFFPAKQYIKHKGQFGIGSDSHISVSPFEELRLLEYGQRLQHQQRNVLCTDGCNSVGRFLYEGAATAGAAALARNSGSIAVGRCADWVVLNDNNPALFSKSNDQILDSAIFSSRENPVKDVMVQGCWRVKDGQHSDELKSLDDYKDVIKSLNE